MALIRHARQPARRALGRAAEGLGRAMARLAQWYRWCCDRPASTPERDPNADCKQARGTAITKVRARTKPQPKFAGVPLMTELENTVKEINALGCVPNARSAPWRVIRAGPIGQGGLLARPGRIPMADTPQTKWIAGDAGGQAPAGSSDNRLPAASSRV